MTASAVTPHQSKIHGTMNRHHPRDTVINPNNSIIMTASSTKSALRNPRPSSVFDPITVSATRTILRQATSNFSVNKLKFDRLRVHGRRKELRELELAARRVAEGRTTAHGSFSSGSAGDKPKCEESRRQRQKKLRKPQKELVLLSGYSGTGKSSLITSPTAANASPSSFEHIVKKELGGSLVMGKFDQILGGGSQKRPFTAFRMLCEQLVHALAALKATKPTNQGMSLPTTATALETIHPPRSSFDQLKEQVRTELETELIGLIKAFPALKVLSSNADSIDQGDTSRGSFSASDHTTLEDENNLSERNDSSSRTRASTIGTESRDGFNFAFRTLIRILSKYLSPLVLVLDDLQWADAASLDLLETLISDHDNTNTMIIGIYRSNEVDETHLLSKMIEKVREGATAGVNKLTITDIEVGNLDIPAVSEVLEFLMGMDKEQQIIQLAELCHKKTGGNPFYLIHYVAMLYDVHLLEFNLGLMRWKWDIEEIEDATTATQNVVDILKKQMTSLSDENQRILKYASYLGSVFEKRLIFVLWKDFFQKTTSTTTPMTSRHPRTSRSDATTTDETAAFDDDDEQEVNTIESIGSSDLSASSIEYVSERLDDAISSCVKSGFLEVIGDEAQTYRWVHDKLQEAAIELIPSDNRREFGQHVAEVLGSQLTDAELEASIFVVVDQFNLGTPPEHPSKRLRLAELNLRAANKAVSYSAFESAALYCNHGITMLPTDCWEKHYQLSLELYSLGAETEGFMGNHPAIELYCQEVLRHRRYAETRRSASSRLSDVRDKLRVYNVRMSNVASREQLQDAVDLCLDVLKQYGVTFPSLPINITLRILYNLMKIKFSMKSRTENEVKNLPIMTDPVLVEQMGLVDQLIAYSYATRSPLFPLAIFKALHWTLQYGLSKFSPPVFATTGVILGGVMGDLNGAATYGNYALMLLAKLDPTSSRAVEARTRSIVHNFVLHWTQPVRSLLKPLLRGYEIGMLSGDTPNACLCIYAYMLQSLVSGRSLVTLEHDCRVYCTQIRGLSIVNILNLLRITWQMVLNLIGCGERTTELTGQALPEDVRNHEAETKTIFKSILNVQKSMLCGYLGDHEHGAALAMERGNSFQKTNPGSALSTSDVFHRCLSLLAMARKRKEVGDLSGVSRTMQVKYIKAAKQALSRIKKWVEQGNPNVRHYEALLDAEFAAYGDRTSIAKKSYEAAAYFAGRGGFLNDSALINERYGEYLLYCSKKQRGKGERLSVNGIVDSSEAYEDEAMFRLKESIKYYREWGALAKVELLESQYDRLLPGMPPSEIMLHRRASLASVASSINFV